MKRAVLIALSALFLSPQPARAEDSLDRGLHWLYQLQYDKARAQFEAHIKAHPDDPAGYFYLTATDWWHLAQDLEYDLPDVRRALADDSRKTIEVAHTLYRSTSDPHQKGLACLYGGGAEGLWGRWLVAQRQYVKAYFAGKRGNAQLKQALDLDPSLYDAYLGIGIYDYFTDTLSGVQKALAAVLIRGSRSRGLKELHIAIDQSKHARVEAICFLIEIYAGEENAPEKALPYAEKLHREFPQSPGMHLIQLSTLYSMKKWDAVLPDANDFLRKAEHETPWYTKRYVAPARYCIGVAKLMGKHDPDGALAEMEHILAEEKSMSRWVSFAHLRRGQIYDLRGQRDKAIEEYREAQKGPNLWGLHAEAGRYIKTPFTFSPASA